MKGLCVWGQEVVTLLSTLYLMMQPTFTLADYLVLKVWLAPQNCGHKPGGRYGACSLRENVAVQWVCGATCIL